MGVSWLWEGQRYHSLLCCRAVAEVFCQRYFGKNTSGTSFQSCILIGGFTPPLCCCSTRCDVLGRRKPLCICSGRDPSPGSFPANWILLRSSSLLRYYVASFFTPLSLKGALFAWIGHKVTLWMESGWHQTQTLMDAIIINRSFRRRVKPLNEHFIGNLLLEHIQWGFLP